jgi:hypothetical protein
MAACFTQPSDILTKPGRTNAFNGFLLEALLSITQQETVDAASRNPDPQAIAPPRPGNSATLRPPMVISAGSWFTILGSNLNRRLGAGGERRLTA